MPYHHDQACRQCGGIPCAPAPLVWGAGLAPGGNFPGKRIPMKIALDIVMGADAPILPIMMNARRPEGRPAAGSLPVFQPALAQPCRGAALQAGNPHRFQVSCFGCEQSFISILTEPVIRQSALMRNPAAGRSAGDCIVEDPEVPVREIPGIMPAGTLR